MARKRSFSTDALSRRRAIAAIGTGLTVGLAGCGGGGDTTTTAPSETDEPTATDAATPTATPNPVPEEYQAQLDFVRSNTESYADPASAMGVGFLPAGPDIPGIGFQMANTDRISATVQSGFNLAEPQLLGFARTDAGLQLAWVGYTGPAAAVPENPDLFNEEDANTDATEQWAHAAAATRVLAIPDGKATDTQFGATPEQLFANSNWSLFQPPNRDLEKGDTVSLNWGSPRGKTGERTERIADSVTHSPQGGLRTLRVWVHMDNPAGMLAPQNPALLPPSMRPGGGGGTPTPGGSNSTSGSSNSTSG